MFQLPTTKPITKEFLLSKNSEENYMEHYLGVPVKKGLFSSPSSLRTDSKPTACFYRDNKGRLMYKDFNGITGDFIEVVQEIYKISYYKALNTIANDFGYITLPNYKKHEPKLEPTNTSFKETLPSEIQCETQNFTKKELSWWANFGISEQTLKKFKVFSIKHVILNGKIFASSSYSSPIYGFYGGRKNGDELWRVYFPTKTTYRFISNWSMKQLQGSKQLPESGDLLVITKSLKDVMTLYENGISAISPTSETIVLDQNQMKKLSEKFKRIIVLYDNDLAGFKGARKYRKLFPNIELFFIKRKHSKDISDLWKKDANKGYNACEELKCLGDKNSFSYFYKF